MTIQIACQIGYVNNAIINLIKNIYLFKLVTFFSLLGIMAYHFLSNHKVFEGFLWWNNKNTLILKDKYVIVAGSILVPQQIGWFTTRFV